MDFSFSDLNFNSVENLPGFEARAAFTVNSASVFREDVDIVPTVVDDSLSYIPWGGDNQMALSRPSIRRSTFSDSVAQLVHIRTSVMPGVRCSVVEKM